MDRSLRSPMWLGAVVAAAGRYAVLLAATTALTVGAASLAEQGPILPTNPKAPVGGVRRVVSLVPSVTEIIFALGEGQRLVGVSTYCDHPPEVAGIERIGTYLEPNLERILAVRPDVVIGVPTPGNQAAVQRLHDVGLQVVIVGETTLEDARQAMLTVGDWVGVPEKARALQQKVDADLEEIRQHTAARPPRRVLLVVGHDPLIAAGSGMYLDDLLRIAGGINVAADVGGRWPHVSLEAVVGLSPEVIIDGAMGSEGRSSVKEYWARFSSLPAVRDGRVRAYRSPVLLRPGPRIVDAARDLRDLIQRDGPSASPAPSRTMP